MCISISTQNSEQVTTDVPHVTINSELSSPERRVLFKSLGLLQKQEKYPSSKGLGEGICWL